MPTEFVICPRNPKALSDIRLNMYRIRREAVEGTPMDREIQNLVKAVNFFGIETDASCKGHLDKNHLHFPWVGWYGAEPDEGEPIDRLRSIIREFNRQSEQKWTIRFNNWLRPKKSARTEAELRVLQRSADSLAEVIFQETIREKLRK